MACSTCSLSSDRKKKSSWSSDFSTAPASEADDHASVFVVLDRSHVSFGRQSASRCGRKFGSPSRRHRAGLQRSAKRASGRTDDARREGGGEFRTW